MLRTSGFHAKIAVMGIVLDKINKQIINHLKDGRISYKKIAKELSIAENTVKSRIQKLRDTGIIDITTLVNPEVARGHTIVYMGIQLNHLALVETAETISSLKGVISSSVVTGRYDLMVVIHLDPGFSLLDFLSNQLSRVEGITVTETFVVYKSFNLKIPHLFDISEIEQPGDPG